MVLLRSVVVTATLFLSLATSRATIAQTFQATGATVTVTPNESATPSTPSQTRAEVLEYVSKAITQVSGSHRSAEAGDIQGARQSAAGALVALRELLNLMGQHLDQSRGLEANQMEAQSRIERLQTELEAEKRNSQSVAAVANGKQTGWASVGVPRAEFLELQRKLLASESRAESLARDVENARSELERAKSHLENVAATGLERERAASWGESLARELETARADLQASNDKLAAAQAVSAERDVLARELTSARAELQALREAPVASLPPWAPGSEASDAVAARPQNPDPQLATTQEIAAPSHPVPRERAPDQEKEARRDNSPTATSALPRESGARQLPADARLVARAEMLMRSRDIGAARLVLERSVAAGNGRSAYLLAETYDSAYLLRSGLPSSYGNSARAAELYAQAAAKGITGE